jgi:hypothetical protein
MGNHYRTRAVIDLPAVFGQPRTSRVAAVGQRILAVLLSLVASFGIGFKAMSDETSIDPTKILFSLPTICDPMPALEEAPAPAGAHWLHEDDWRQIEFVAVANRDYIQRQLAALAAFKQQHWRGAGWDSVYTRAEHPTPLVATGLYLDKDQGLTTSALTIGEPPRPVRGGFAFSNGSDWFIYGQRAADGQLVQMGLWRGNSHISDGMAEILSRFAQAAHVMLVDWERGTVVDTSSVRSVLQWAASGE